MITHIVLIGWAPHTPTEVRERAREIARGFVGRIPGLLQVTEGPSTSPERLEGPHEYGMVMTFADAAARDGYLPHPVHREFTALLADGAASRVTVFDIEN